MKRGRFYLILALALLLGARLPVLTAQSADLTGAKALKKTGEQPAVNAETDNSSREALVPSQKPAADLENELRGFPGFRGPPTGTDRPEITFKQDRNGHFIVQDVDPNGRFANEYKPGDTYPRSTTAPTHNGGSNE